MVQTASPRPHGLRRQPVAPVVNSACLHADTSGQDSGEEETGLLYDIHDKEMTRVPHGKDFEDVVRRLGTRSDQVREGLNEIIDELSPDAETGLRTFSSSHLGSKLTPWEVPLRYLRDVAREIEGPRADDEQIGERAGLLFGLFVWECMMNRDERWHFHDPNLSAKDPNREITGKWYFEEAD